jgi:hypothetical protein
MLLDPELLAYQAYGLKHSFWRSWSPRTIWYYARAVMRREPLPESHEDTHQLGGDFIVDRQGTLRLSHPSADPTDRPPVSKILSVLQAIQ